MSLAASGKKSLFQSNLFKEIKKTRYLYLLLLPGLLYYVVFHYLPIYGISIAFKEFNARLGILGSHFIGLRNYEFVFKDPDFFNALKNTFIISFCRILFQFPIPIALALLINEMRGTRYKRVLQTVYTFPNFLSWVIVGGILINFLGDQGAINGLLSALGMDKISFLSDKSYFVPLLYITENWKSAGWASIIYIAAIAGINVDQYEAATIDGANRFDKLFHITLPGIKGTISVMFILAVGNVMNAGFDQIFNISNPAVRSATDILDTYIYRVTFSGPTDFGFSAAVGLFKSVINFSFLIICDRVAKGLGERGLYY